MKTTEPRLTPVQARVVDALREGGEIRLEHRVSRSHKSSDSRSLYDAKGCLVERLRAPLVDALLAAGVIVERSRVHSVMSWGWTVIYRLAARAEGAKDGC